MKFIDDDRLPVLELTRRNLRTLLAKLDQNLKVEEGYAELTKSACTIIDPDRRIMVCAVEDEKHYADRPPGPMLIEGEIV